MQRDSSKLTSVKHLRRIIQVCLSIDCQREFLCSMFIGPVSESEKEVIKEVIVERWQQGERLNLSKKAISRVIKSSAVFYFEQRQILGSSWASF